MAQLLVSIMRAVGPATANSLFSLSIDDEHHYMGGYFVYYALSAIVLVAFWVGTLLPDDPSFELEDNVKSLPSSSSSSSAESGPSSSSSSTFTLRR
uniref:Non-canonical non-ribosomal peptide synthetase FUB8 ) n=1 Tax=Ganoderma boninense TaxID=34458 RepID=A0A5K1K4W6_9APHY|nr:Non-canonical non-ribosomal peptide synthetase FUB8 (EC (Fusaric acid biosynthesis protein 8) [Ganoderma boninense]